MLYIALTFVMVLPLFGVIAMESGEISGFVDEAGAPNGASVAYSLHLLAFAVAFFLVARRGSAKAATKVPHLPELARNLDIYATFCAVTFAVLAVLMVFGYGGINVLLLNVDRAEFRTSLGPFGAFMTVATKWLIPTMFAALVYAVSSSGWSAIRRLMVSLAALSLLVVGISWGFKTTVLFMLLPTFIVVAWSVRIRTLVWIVMAALALIFSLAIYFDQYQDTTAALDALILRLTALQGDLAWYTWGRVATGHATPAYLQTFLPVLGDRTLELLTGERSSSNYANWASYYFAPAMTIWGGFPAENVQAGVTNQATLFAESVVIGGKYFFYLISGSFGALTGLFARWIRTAIRSGNPQSAATLATFFSLTVLPWVLGNGLASLLYLINIVGGLASYVVVSAFFKSRRPPLHHV